MKRLLKLSFCVSALCGAACAQDTATVRGVVVNSVTRQPIARVLVESPNGGAGVLTDNAGRFSFSGVPAGQVQLRYRRPGYLDPSSQQGEASAAAVAGADQTLQLEPAAVLSGQLTLADGDTPAGMRVELYRAEVTDGHRRWQIQSSMAVRSDGSFAFESLRPGRYLVHAEGSLDPVPPDAKPGIRSGYAPAYAPGVGELGSATVFALAPGQTEEARLRVSRAPFYPVAVRVAGDAPLRNLRITGNGFTRWTPRYDRSEQMLTTELPSGTYTLRAGGGELPFRVEDAPVSGLSVEVSHPADIPFEVQTEGTPASQTSNPPRVNLVTLIPVSPEMPSFSEGVRYNDAGEGSLPVEVAPGRYWVWAFTTGGYIRSLSSNGVDLLAAPLNLVPGTAPRIQAVIAEDGGTLSVSREGDAAGPCTVQIVPLFADGRAETRTVADASAQAVFGNVPPGDYLVLATASQEQIAYREPGILEQLRGARVTVAQGAPAQTVVSALFTPDRPL